MKKLPKLFIDVDNTILKNPFELGVFPYICKRISARSSLTEHEILNMLSKESRKRESKNQIDAFDWDDIVQKVTERLNLKNDFSVKQLVESFSKEPYIAVLPNVKETLEILEKKNYPIYFVSNGFSKYQQPVIEALSLNKFCLDLITSDKVNHLKSEKEFYDDYLEENVQIISIGDSYLYDVYYPKLFGFCSFWIVYPEDNLKAKLKPFSPIERIAYSDQVLKGSRFNVIPDAIIFDFAEIIPTLDNLHFDSP